MHQNDDEHYTANERKWSRRSVTYDSKRHDYFRLIQKKLIDSVTITAPCHFLDLGCGTGWAVHYVAKMLDGNGKFVGVDIAKGMIEKARSNFGAVPNVTFLEAKAEDLPLENDFFDTAICTNSFHHYLQPNKALQELQRVLKLNGRLYVLDLTADDFFTRWLDSRFRAREKEHVKFYSTADYVKMFVRAGLKHIRGSRIKMYPLKVHVGVKET